MALVRVALALALVAAGTVAGAADAAPKPGTRCIGRDVARDVRVTDAGPAVDVRNLDLLSADLLVSRPYFVAVIRTAEGGGEGVWKMTFTVGRTKYFAVAARGAGNPLDPDSEPGYRFGIVGGATYPTVGRVDRNETWIYGRWPSKSTKAPSFTVAARRPVASADGTDVSILDRLSSARC